MHLCYRDDIYPSFKIRTHGWFCLWDEGLDDYIYNRRCCPYYSSEVSDTIISSEDNDKIFHEIDICEQINKNENNYFDLNKSLLDIGANYGGYALFTNFKYVYAIEPNKKINVLLNTNLILHDKFENSIVYDYLLSDKVETIEYDGFNTKLIDQNNNLFNENISSKVSTHILDELNLNNIGLIKVDVEGMEEKVLRGGLGTIIRNNYPPILFELWDVGEFGMTQEKHESMVNFLSNLGYRILWYWGDKMTHLAIHM